MKHRNVTRLLLALSLLWSASSWAQPTRIDGSPADEPQPGDGPPSAPCADGIVRDDSTAEAGWGWIPSVIDGRYVQEFRLEEMPTNSIERFCVCLRRTQADTDLDFNVHFYAHEPFIDEDDGSVVWVPELEPYAVVPASATNITDQVAGTWVEVDVGGIEPPIGPYFSVGIQWNPSLDQFFFICGDTTEETPASNVWFIDDRASGWTSVLNTIDPIFNVHRAFMMRIVPGAHLPTPIEVPTVNRHGLRLMVLALAGLGLWVVLRRR